MAELELLAPSTAPPRVSLSARTVTTEDLRDLLPLMPRAVDLLWRRGSGPVQCDEAGETVPMPLLHFALPLDDMEAARAFLRDRLLSARSARGRQADGRHVERWRGQDNRARRAEHGSAGRRLRPVRLTTGSHDNRLFPRACTRFPSFRGANLPMV